MLSVGKAAAFAAKRKDLELTATPDSPGAGADKPPAFPSPAAGATA